MLNERRSFLKRVVAGAFLIWIVMLCAYDGHSANGGQITPVSGPSWLNVLRIPFELSCMGRTGRWGPPPPVEQEEVDGNGSNSDLFLLTGADLYRYSCRACHRPSGLGCGSEIKSLLNPVRTASPDYVQKMMAARGRPIPRAFAERLAAQSASSLLQRLQQGGEKMPSFGYLRADEVNALLHYLRKLAGLPQTNRPEPRLIESWPRVGELLVKGTCHICHNATDEGGPYGLINAHERIPSLAEIVGHRTMQEVINKVRRGAIVPGERRGRMPIFSYLTEQEVAAIYLYLQMYPPQP